jgi:hypothetical protein
MVRYYYNENFVNQLEMRVDEEVMVAVRQAAAGFIEKLLKTINKEGLEHVAKNTRALWEKHVRQEVEGAHRQSAYIRGMQAVEATEGKVTLRLRGFDALRVEKGWAPPQTAGSTLEDGLGQYTGRPMDLRPLLLFSGKPAETVHPKFQSSGRSGKTSWKEGDLNLKKGKPTRSGATFYKVINMPVVEGNLLTTMESFATSVGEWLQTVHQKRAEAELEETTRSDGTTLKDHKKVIELLRNRVGVAKEQDENNLKRWGGLVKKLLQDASDYGKATLRAPKSFPKTYKTIIKDETTGDEVPVWHKRFIYDKLHVKAVFGGKQRMSESLLKFNTLRTISNAPSQIAAHRWFAKGNPGVDLLGKDSPLMADIAQLIMAGTGATMARSSPRPQTRTAEVKVSADPAAAGPVQPTVQPASQPVTQPVSTAPAANPYEARARELFQKEHKRGGDTAWQQFQDHYLGEAKREAERAEAAVNRPKPARTLEDDKREAEADRLFRESAQISETAYNKKKSAETQFGD